MERYRLGDSVGSWQREAQVGGIRPLLGADEWRAKLREQERILGVDDRLGPYGLLDSDRAQAFRSGALGLGPQQQQQLPRRPELGPREEGPYARQRESDILPLGLLGLRKGGPYTLDSLERGRLGPLSPLSGANHARDLPSYSGLSRDLAALSSQPSEREAYLLALLRRERESHSGLSREQSLFQARDLSLYMDPEPRRDRSPGPSRQLSPSRFATKESSPYTNLTRDLNHRGAGHDISRLLQAPLSRSRSPLRDRDLSALRELLDRARSPPSKAYPPSLFSLNLSRPNFLDGGGSARGAQPVEKQPTTGSVVRVDGLPTEDTAACIAPLLTRLGQFGTVTDTQLHRGPTEDYALIFFAEADAAYLALKYLNKYSQFGKTLRFSLWVMVADRDQPITLALTRVMYLENLDKSVTVAMLHKVCGQVGEILDIELQETPGSPFNTAIVQYWDAQNAKIAAQTLDLAKLGKRVKTVAGKNRPSNCVWVDGLPKDLDEHRLTKYFDEYGHVDKFVFDRKRGAALILFPARVPARQCVRYLENGKATLKGQVIRADYANDRAQLAFCREMEKSGQEIGNFLYA